MEKKNELKPVKKSLWTLVKESMDKTSSGCGPECGCHVEKKDDKNKDKDTNGSPETDKEQS